MNPRVIRFMKISLPVSTFSLLLLSACAGEGYAEDGLTDNNTPANSNVSDTPSETAKKDESKNGKSKLLSFEATIKNDLKSFKNIDKEKNMATQQYTDTKNKPITVSRHAQKIENKVIYANKSINCGININGYNDVQIKNVTIYHANTGVCANNAKRLKISGLKLVSLAAPTTGPHCPRSSKDGLSTAECWGQRNQPADSRLGISLKNSPHANISNFSSFQASSGVYAINSPQTTLSKIRCYDMRGPFPRGQCVQFNRSNNSSITTFYAKNVFNQSHSEDNINAYQSDNIKVSNGLIDGNWSTHGMGIIADKGSDNMQIKDVDFLNISTAAINVWSSDLSQTGKNFRATRLRIKNTQCFSRKGGKPSTHSLIIAAQPNAINPNFSDIRWFNHCRSSTTWCLPGQGCRKNNTGSLINFRQEDFKTRWTFE